MAAAVAAATSYAVGGDVATVLAALASPAPGWSRLLLCRHGETASNKTKLLQGGGADTPLNELGHLQSEQLAAALASSGVTVHTIATSHLTRAITTGTFSLNLKTRSRPSRAFFRTPESDPPRHLDCPEAFLTADPQQPTRSRAASAPRNGSRTPAWGRCESK